MLIEKFRHKGLRRLYDDDDPRALPAGSVRKIRRSWPLWSPLSQVATMPGWKLHPLNRRGEDGITVTANRRITSRLRGKTVTDVDFEDYH
jgi:toxin HigB-1